MKHVILKSTLALLLVGSLFTYCSDSSDHVIPEDRFIEGKDGTISRSTSLSECKDELSSRADAFPTEYLTYRVKGNVLEIMFHNFLAPCDMTKMDVEVAKTDDQLVFTTNMLDGGAVNCICPIDFNFSVEGLTTGKTYSCIFKNGNYSKWLPFELTMKEGAEGTIELKYKE